MKDITTLQCIMMLKVAYPRQELTDNTIDLYQHMLADIDPALLKTAVMRQISQSVFFPAIAELRATAADLRLELQGYPSAGEAWYIANHGDRKTMREEIKTAVKIGCNSFYDLQRDTMPYAARARFIEAYNQIMSEKRKEVMEVPEVKGYLEQSKKTALPAGTLHVGNR